MKLFFSVLKFVPLGCFAASFALQAELPPYVYDEMKRNAPEVFNVRIVEAPKKAPVAQGKRQKITYEAKVLQVIRTKSRIKSGEAIVIQSYHYAFGPGEVGPSNPRRLKENDVVLAYLTKGEKGDEFRIAAGGHSFERIKQERKGRSTIDVPANPTRAEPVPAPDIRVEPVNPRPEFPPAHPIGEPHFGGTAIGGGMAMAQAMPGRYTLLSTQIQQAGKLVPVVLKLDTQTGAVWQLKLMESKFFVNGQMQVRTRMNFEPVMHDREPDFNPRRPDIEIETDGLGETIPDRPIFRPRPVPVRPRTNRRNLIEPTPSPRR
ncbi:MAG: hypothetical protein QF600_08205 [Verrucomicrobiota bacterium]|jgi:hypothetical protein|nr:hypothetical protein [Verrucomicrobiota bacterium]